MSVCIGLIQSGLVILTDRFMWDESHEVVPRVGVEPTAFPLGGGRSIQLSYRGTLSKPV